MKSKIKKASMPIKSGPETSLKRSTVAVPPPVNFVGALIPIIASAFSGKRIGRALTFLVLLAPALTNGRVKKKSTNKLLKRKRRLAGKAAKRENGLKFTSVK